MQVRQVPPVSQQQYYHGHPAVQEPGAQQPALQPNGSYPEDKHPASAYSNGGYPNGSHQNGAYQNGSYQNGRPVPADEMNPYQQHSYHSGYGYPPAGYGQPQQYPPSMQQQLPPPQPHQPPPQLPPIHTSNIAAPPIYGLQGQYAAPPVSHAPQPPLYNSSQAMPGLPPAQHSTPAAQHIRSPDQLTHTGSDDSYYYTLVVEQQPARARMCGFGDKDRRPITPPPCVRLIIRDCTTNEEIPMESIDGTFFVLQVDLWDEHGYKEVNIVRASSSTPSLSISNSTTTSFPPAPERTMVGMEYGMQYAQDGTQYPGYYQRQQSMSGYPGMMQQGYPGGSGGYGGQTGSNPMFTRNLIGSLTVNAARLKDAEGKEGYWFVLQDLSVRTEGHFRLKMNFIDLRAKDTSNSLNSLNRGRAPVLAWVFSDKFQVFSAKKFPGVIESTPLSKCFAQQGIKIPIRKDMKGEAKNEDDDED